MWKCKICKNSEYFSVKESKNYKTTFNNLGEQSMREQYGEETQEVWCRVCHSLGEEIKDIATHEE